MCPTNAMAVYQCCIHGETPGMERDIVKVTERIRHVKVNGWNNKAVLEAEARCNYLEAAASCICLACHGLN